MRIATSFSPVKPKWMASGRNSAVNQKTVRIYEASVCEQPEEALEDGTQIVPGMIVRVTKKNFTVACGNGALMIRKLQPEGKKPMDCAAFLAGNKLKTGQMIYE